MKNLIGKHCLIKYDINLMLDIIVTIVDVNEQQRWIKTNTGNNSWFTEDSILLIADMQTLHKVLEKHQQLLITCDLHKTIESEIKSDILKHIDKLSIGSAP